MTSVSSSRNSAVRLVAMVVLITGLLALAPAARAQTSVAKIATANVVKIFKDLQETKDLNAKWQSDESSFKNQDLEKTQHLKDLAAARDALKPDAPNYEKAQNDFIQAQIEYTAWKQITLANVQRTQKLQIAQLFNKITTTVAEVAAKKGIDLVIAEQRQDLPENLETVNVQQLQGLITSRNVLYVASNIDITGDVIQTMDQKYKSGK